uniref:Uncharacterized protein n=1 Tax=Sebdenia flabellata TaxID=42024 RepID=A0A1C9CA18_9FLOR|nr:hypothetical protein Sebd_128 [Sebdenia flabellata]AOM65215.1 hypothetical protein Sebd_128 [Sebdenia flabellata]
MKIVNLTKHNISTKHNNISFAIKLNQIKDIWLFNCIEGCQHYCIYNQIKISQISKIIITELKISNISGLLGLLSSLNLTNRTKALSIYGPAGINKYLNLIKKYSKTNFRYNLYVFILKTGLSINSNKYLIYTFINKKYSDFIIINTEQQIKFNLRKAKQFNLLAGPLYGKLKKSYDFLLPDGITLYGQSFIKTYQAGRKILFILNKHHTRQSIEISFITDIVYFKQFS